MIRLTAVNKWCSLAADKISNVKLILLFFTVVFGKQIYKRLLLFSQLPAIGDRISSFSINLARLTVAAGYCFWCRESGSGGHSYPQNFQATNATTSQNRAETKKTAIQALRFRAGSLCGCSLPDDIASLIQSTPLIVIILNNRYN